MAPVLRQAAGLLRQGARSLSLSKEENLHLTLRFLGDMPPERAQQIQAWFGGYPPLNQAARQVSLSHWGLFSQPQGDTVWAGLQVTQALRQYVAQLELQVRTLGFAPQQAAFVPHVTLARRVRWQQQAQAVLATLPRLESLCLLGPATLFESQFSPQGMRYTPLVVRKEMA